MDHAIMLMRLLQTMFCTDNDFKIEAGTDSNNLNTALHSTTQVEDKRLQFDIAYMKDSVAANDITVFWCRWKPMLADCLTKSGCSSDMLLKVVSRGSLEGHHLTKK